jgi:hypothetical protein
MKYVLIMLGVVAAVVLTLGAFNRELAVDVDYAVGVWRSVNAFWLFAIGAGLIVAAGVVSALLAQAGGWRARGKLEKELLDVYRRLRAVEGEQAEQAAPAAEAEEAEQAAQETMTAAAPAEAATEIAAEPDELGAAGSPPDVEDVADGEAPADKPAEG